jgi:hypothetical protein
VLSVPSGERILEKEIIIVEFPLESSSMAVGRWPSLRPPCIDPPLHARATNGDVEIRVSCRRPAEWPVYKSLPQMASRPRVPSGITDSRDDARRGDGAAPSREHAVGEEFPGSDRR